MNHQLIERMDRVLETYHKVDKISQDYWKYTNAAESLKKQKELAEKGSIGEWIIATLIADIPFTILMYLAKIHPLILLPFMIVTIVILRKKLHSFNVKRQNFDERIAKQEEQAQECQTWVDIIFSEHQSDISIIPSAFLKELETIEMHEMFHKIIATGRADSIKEAINVFYDDMRKMRMEEDNRHAAFCQEQMLQSVKNAEYQAQRTADMIALQNLFGNNNN